MMKQLTKPKWILYPFLILAICYCQSPTESDTASQGKQEAKYPELLIRCLNAHGGLDHWDAMSSLQYKMVQGEKEEIQLFNLKNRKALITHTNYAIGFDGQDVWVTPNKAAYSGRSARFYHNLNFYFFAIPFVLADPGIIYEQLPDKEIDNKKYKVLKISYLSGIGDAPDDYYILHLDPETYRLEWLLYTVTYYRGSPNDRFSALHYANWQEVDGLWLPESLKGYRYNTDTGEVGEERYTKIFSDVVLQKVTPDESLFRMPENAEVDSLPAIQ